MTVRQILFLLLVLAFQQIHLAAQSVAARIVALRGRVEVGTDTFSPAVLNQDLLEGDRIRTFQRSRAVLLLADETQLKLNANTQFQLRSVNRSSNLVTRIADAGARAEQSILNLDRGQIYVRSKKTPARVSVRTPAVTAAIRGTEFDILVRSDGETLATVLDGSIDYSNDFGSIVVNSGEQGRARIGEAPTKMVILNPEDAVQWTLFYTAAVSGRDYPFTDTTGPEAQSALAAGIGDPVRRAMLQHDAGRPDEALSTLEGLTTARAAEIRGWLLLEQNRIAEAFQELQSADRTSPRTRLGISIAHLRAGEFDLALSSLEPATEDESLQVQKALLLLLLGSPEEAGVLLETLPATGRRAALGHGLRSTILLTQNQKEEALQEALKAVESDPSSPSAYVALSRVQQSFFQLEEATQSALRALEADNNFLDAQVQYARLLFGSGETAKAEQIAREALTRAPEEAAVNSLLGFAVLARGQTEEAEALFQKAIGQDSTQADPRLGLGIVKMRRNEHLDATAEMMAATTLEPRLSLYQSYLAKAFYELREFEQAFTALDTAQTLDPRDPTPHFYSGIFEDDLNRPGRAVLDFQESIRLNDNRAVYRSRYLLDQDRAARNVNLARSFVRLGLAEWGNAEAVSSQLDDPTNSSAHLFLANTFLNLPGRTLAAGSELLLARLLLPVNANSFNAFNDYTTLFELPRLYWTVRGQYGSFDSFGGNLIASGGTRRLAYSVNLNYERDGGFRTLNDESRNYTGVSFVKVGLSPESDLLLTYEHQQINQGDPGSSVLVNELPGDPDVGITSRLQRAEIGYHRRLRPGSELLLLFSGQELESVTNDPNFRVGRICTATFCERRFSVREPHLDFQTSHILDTGALRLNYGLDVFEGRRRDGFTLLIESGDSLLVNPFPDELKKIRYKTVFFRSDLDLLPNLVLSTGVNWDWSNDDNRADSDQASTSRWNPQGGLFFQPFSSTQLRFAYFQNLQTQRQARLVPPHLLGFPIDQNEEVLAHSRSYNLGWDQRIGNRTFLRSTIFWRDRKIPSSDFLQNAVLFDGQLYGGRTTVSRFLTERWTLVSDYSVTRNLDRSSLRHDHEIDLSMRYVHPKGIFLTARENYLRQTGRIGAFDKKVKVFTTDFEMAYEMPEKWGLVIFTLSNLFDRRYEFLVDPLALETRIPARQARLGLRFNF